MGMVRRVWGECLCGVRGVIVESGLLGWCAGALGIWGEGKKNFITLWLLLKLRISGGSEFCFKIYVEREILRERGCGLGWKDEGRRLSAKERELPERGCGLG